MYDYAIRFEEDGSAPGVAVFCRDLPELNSFGDTREHAISEAVDAIESTLSLYVDSRRAIPKATAPEEGEHVVHLPAVTTAKIVLWNKMMDKGMRKSDLCRLLEISQTQGDRLVDFLHGSKIDAIEHALLVLGARLAVVAMQDDGISVVVYSRRKSDCHYSHLLRRSDTPLENVPAEVSTQFAGIKPNPVPVELGGMWLIEPCAKELESKGWALAEMKHA